MADQLTVGDVRAFIARSYDAPHTDETHFVIVAEWPGSMLVGTCCDDMAEVTDLLRTVLRDIGTGAPVLPVVSPSVIVHRTDLQRILDPGKTPADVLARLRRALGEVSGA